MYPKIHIDLDKFKNNVYTLTKLLKESHISMMAVTKVFLADQNLIEIINESDIEYIADSRIENLQKIKTNKKKVLLRIPMLSEIDKVILSSDVSLNSELKTIQKLNIEAKKQKKHHSIILMFDIGDLREGLYDQDEYLNIVKNILDFEDIHLLGIGVNLTCYGAVIPTIKTYKRLEKIKKNIELTFDIQLEMISGGNSSTLPLVLNKKIPNYINNLRIGEALVMGRETSYHKNIKGLYQDVFTLEIEVIESKFKPSMPEGILGFDAFGQKVNYLDEGFIYRTIFAIGRQDIDPSYLVPKKNIKILGSSSDHLITKTNKKLKIGEKIKFRLTYGGILNLMTSPYVVKNYEKQL
jgi:predicted amino acid racemase